AEPGENPEDRPGHQAGLKLILLATGKLVKFDERLEEYLSTLRNERKTVDMKRSTIKKFCAEFTYVADVQRKAVQKWVNAQAQAEMAVSTIRRALSEVRGYWAYLVSLQEAPEESDPFDKLALPSGGKNSNQDKRKDFASAEVLRLLNEARERKDAE